MNFPPSARLRSFSVCALLVSSLLFAAPAAQRKPASMTAFVDVTRVAGIDFHLTCGGSQKLYIMESLCGGVAFIDYDNDGWPDIFLVNGSTLEDLKTGRSPASKLYHNNHDGTFTDVTEKAGLAHRGWCMGAAVGDYDNDGWDDLYITCLTGSFLYKNNGDGTFSDVSVQAGVGNLGRWGTSAAFGDYDRDGYLDLYVANYVDLDLNNLPKFGSSLFCQYRGIPVSCGPRGLRGSRDRLYHNNGDGTFTDVTEKMNIDRDSHYGLGVIWADYDDDGLPDLVKTNFSDDANNLYHNNGDGTFDDRAGAASFGAVSVPFLGFGVRFLDYDNDGWKDILVANGHVNPQVDEHAFGITYAQRALLFHNLRDGRFEEVGLRAGPALAERRVSRGLAVADINNDGALAVLISNLDGSPTLLRNVVKPRGHWINMKLIGTRSNRDAYGARVEIVARGLKQVDEVRANSSYLSGSDARLHFGLGSATRVDQVVIRWPSGVVEKLTSLPVDRGTVIWEGTGEVMPLQPRR